MTLNKKVEKLYMNTCKQRVPRTQTWHGINWHIANAVVYDLQVRILVAYRESNHSEVARLQNQLSRSFAGRALAVRRVTTNAGKGTPGIDGVVWSTPKEKFEAIQALLIDPEAYKAKPARRVWISKDGKPLASDKSNGRPLGIPAMDDRALQALWMFALVPIAEEVGDRHSYGFRPYRGAHDAIKMTFTRFANRYRPTWVLEADIEKFYDKISHTWIMENIPMDKSILKQWLKAGHLERGQVWDTDTGVPQGGIISPIIANMTLDGLETVIRKAVAPYTTNNPKRVSKKRHATKVSMIRYADDFIVSAARKELIVEVIKPAIEEFLEARGIRLSPKKTLITNISTGFDFLGFNIRLYKDDTRPTGEILLTKPSEKSMNKIRQRSQR